MCKDVFSLLSKSSISALPHETSLMETGRDVVNKGCHTHISLLRHFQPNSDMNLMKAGSWSERCSPYLVGFCRENKHAFLTYKLVCLPCYLASTLRWRCCCCGFMHIPHLCSAKVCCFRPRCRKTHFCLPLYPLCVLLICWWDSRDLSPTPPLFVCLRVACCSSGLLERGNHSEKQSMFLRKCGAKALGKTCTHR